MFELIYDRKLFCVGSTRRVGETRMTQVYQLNMD